MISGSPVWTVLQAVSTEVNSSMKCAILAAGRGSRLGSITKTLPKFFLNFDGNSVYKNQMNIIEDFCDEVVLVLGHGFVEKKSGVGKIDQYGQVTQEHIRDNIYYCSHPAVESEIKIKKIKEQLDMSFDINVDILVIPYWNVVDNAESCRQAMKFFQDENLMLLSGDRFLSKSVLEKAINKFNENTISEPYHVVSALNSVEKDKTAVNWDESGRIIQYGVLEGYPDTGVFIIDKRLAPESMRILENNPEKWWPIIFTELPSYVSTVDPSQHHEINIPRDIHNLSDNIPNI